MYHPPHHTHRSPNSHLTPQLFIFNIPLYIYIILYFKHPMLISSSFCLHESAKMREKATIFLIIFFFASFFSYLPSIAAVPPSRSLTHGYRSNQHLYHHVFQMKEGRNRIDVEVTDYSGTGANNHHDPKPPPGTS